MECDHEIFGREAGLAGTFVDGNLLLECEIWLRAPVSEAPAGESANRSRQQFTIC